MVNLQQPKDPLSEHPLPPSDFSDRPLPITECQTSWYRLNPIQYSSGLYFDRSGRGRNDSPQQGYGILYVGFDIQTTFIECFGRVHGAIGVAETDLRKRALIEITANRPLKLVDLWGNGLVKIGADARLSSGSYLIARAWAKAIWEHPEQVDGIRYHSRHDDTRFCCGLFDRCLAYLTESNKGTLIDNYPTQLADILDHYGYGLF